MTIEPLTIDTAIEIERPLDAVWQALTGFTAYGDWNPYLVRIDGEARAGSTITVHSRPAPDAGIMVQPVIVLSVDKPRMRWEGGLPDRTQFKGDHWFALDAISPGITRLRHYEYFTGALAATIIEAHGDAIRANFIRFNEALKSHVESES